MIARQVRLSIKRDLDNPERQTVSSEDRDSRFAELAGDAVVEDSD